MWNKLFRSKSSKSLKSEPLQLQDSSLDENRNCDLDRQPTSLTFVPTPSSILLPSSSKQHSRFSKVVKSFKRSKKVSETPNDVTPITSPPSESGGQDTSSSDVRSTVERLLPISDNPKNVNCIPIEPPPDITLELKPCPICTRTFVPATLAKHVTICEKMALKKRKQFDSSRQRREGTDLADFLPKNFGLPQAKIDPKLSPKAVQAPQVIPPPKKVEEPMKSPVAIVAKKAISPVAHQPTTTTPKEKTRPVAKRSMSLPSEQCPYCERSFGLKAYDRHVEWCKEKARLNQQQNSSILTAAKERLQARTKYRAPCLKTKRAANREKYSGMSCGESTNSLSDGGGAGNYSPGLGSGGKSKSNLEDGKMSMSMSMSMSTSMTSSVMSDSSKGIQAAESLPKKIKESSQVTQNQAHMSLKKNPVACSMKDSSPPIDNCKPVTPVTDIRQKAKKILKKSVVNAPTSFACSNGRQKLAPLKLSNEEPLKILEKCALQDPIIAETPKIDGRKRLPPLHNSKQASASVSHICLSRLNDLSVNTENLELSVTPCNLSVTENLSHFDSAVGTTARTIAEIPIERKILSDIASSTPKSSKKTKTLKDFDVACKSDEHESHRIVTILSPRIIPQDSVPQLAQTNSPASKFRGLTLKGYVKPVASSNACVNLDISVFDRNESILTKQENFYSQDDMTLSPSLTEDEEFDSRSKLSAFHPYSPSKSYTIRGLSDKYDPFLSAKRQLEELCSPMTLLPPDLLHSTPNRETKQTPGKGTSTSTTTPNPRATLNTVKSNFRRTSSLRVPRKLTPTRTIFIPPMKQPKPTIQRGISDEGPISHSFLKPEEYDEMPVKSVCVNDFAARHHHFDSLHHSPKVIKRDSATNRRNLKLNLSNKSIDKSSSNTDIPLTKTDSLAVFLKYENETKNLDLASDLTEKDIKDKSNSLSKKTSLKNSVNDLNNTLSEREKLVSIKNSMTNMLEITSPMIEKHNQNTRGIEPLQFSAKAYPIKLEPLPKILSTCKPSTASCHNSSKLLMGPLNLNSILDPKDNTDFIDPKLINVCDNLPINITKLSDSDLTSSSTESGNTTKYLHGSQNQIEPQSQQSFLQQPSSNRNSTEKRNLLKRQIRLGKNQILYDMSPESDPYSEECDKTISIIDTDSNKVDPCSDEPIFDDFDFEEFITRFEDDEQYPIFKDYKEFLSNLSVSRRSNNYNQNLGRSPTILTTTFDGDNEKEQIHMDSEKNLRNETHPSPTFTNPTLTLDTSPTQHGQDFEINDCQNRNDTSPKLSDQSSVDEKPGEIRSFDDTTDVNQNCMKSTSSPSPPDEVFMDQNERICESATSMYPVDSDEISSVECFPLRRSLQSKQSADSAYGSLSRQSPIDRSQRRNLVRSRQQIINMPDLCLSKPKHTQKIEIKGRNRDLSASSSGSDTSLPPIQTQMDKEKYVQMNNDKRESKMSKFCHECGNKFLVSQAKFCMECGVKRIVLE